MITCGIDPSRAKLAVSVVKDREEIDYFEVVNDAKGHRDLLQRIHQRGAPSGIYIEGYADFAMRFALHCTKHSIELYEINPLKSKKLKESATWNKTDHIDAKTAALLPFINHELHPLRIDVRIEALKRLTRSYNKISKNITHYKNQLHTMLNANFGQVYKQLFKTLTKTALAFFIRFPDPKLIKQAEIKEIKEALTAMKSRLYMGRGGTKKATKIKQIILDNDPEDFAIFSQINADLINTYADILLKLLIKKEFLENKIKILLDKFFPKYIKVFRKKLKGIGIVSIATLIAEIGNIDRFKNDGKLAAFAGQAPRILQSANSVKTARRNSYNRYLANVIHMIALNNVTLNAPFYDYYQKKLSQTAKKLRALKSVKRILCKIIFKLFKQLQKENINYVTIA